MSKIIEMIKLNQEKKEQDKLKQLILNNNELIKLLKQSEIDSLEIEQRLTQLNLELDLQEDILVDLFNFFKKSSDRFLSIQEKMKSEKNLKKEEKRQKDMKKENKKMKLKDSDFDDDIKNIKTMVNFLLNHYEKKL
ncbi:hypothetical protein CWN47_08960 [Klebsiella variicola]|uniref:Uncharacterized protein n=1 Tax=Klebsiella variicola TaxID=244366 RepID=A0A2N5ALV0_KLEVA|nr:hypothetical protein CWN47_08960 [Klebsiella variicola]PLP48521.1 hypothetical protein CWM98_03250 [Klebsiella variicola]RWS75366.1 hypothetical protein DN596_30955 [Klebsiella pneumoniae]